ncbi:hypothetical protein [Gordonia sp. X0973]|uniref:hypothetical protein n=1 Tax=Gordonia sp. X0973 TaxID=2742602 RepID=UPI003464608E
MNESIDGWNCFVCDVRGDSISIIRHEEGISFEEAQRRLQEIAPGSDVEVHRVDAGKSRRGVSANPRAAGRRDRAVRARVRG